MAARQLLEAYYQQVLGDGFFHADPHPGNLMWWNDTIYLLDLGMASQARGLLDPGHWFYEALKARVRVSGLLEALERPLGARGGGGLQVDFRGTRDLTAAIRLAGRRIAVGLAAATAIVGTAVTASAVHAATWPNRCLRRGGRAADRRPAHRRSQGPLNGADPGPRAAPARPPAQGRDDPSPARPPGRRWPPRAVLNALMSLAVIVLEWRIRRALRSGAGAGRQPD